MVWFVCVLFVFVLLRADCVVRCIYVCLSLRLRFVVFGLCGVLLCLLYLF